jgi:hypothetical protein
MSLVEKRRTDHMNYETKERNHADAAVEIETTELETIAAARQVQSGVRAGLSPCL